MRSLAIIRSLWCSLQNGTFTLSNIGAIGGTYASPVVSVPQVAIGALGKTQKLPRFDSNDNVYAAHVMKVRLFAMDCSFRAFVCHVPCESGVHLLK